MQRVLLQALQARLLRIKLHQSLDRASLTTGSMQHVRGREETHILAAAKGVELEVALQLVAHAAAHLAAVRHDLLQIPLHVLQPREVPVAVEVPFVCRGLHLLLYIILLHLNVPVVPDLHPKWHF